MVSDYEKLVARFVELMEGIRSRPGQRAPREWTELDLTMPQVRAVSFLSHGPQRMGAIATHLDVKLSSATSMVGRLVKRGLLERFQEPHDRRIVACRLTPAGEQALEGFQRFGRMKAESLARVLGTDELRQVVPALLVLNEATARLDSRPQETSEEAVTPAAAGATGER